MTIDDLRSEIAADPLGIGYRPQDPMGVHAALRTTRPGCTRQAPLVPIVRAIAFLAAPPANLRARIRATASNPEHIGQSLCLGVEDILARQTITSIDMSEDSTLAMLDGLVATGVITSAERTAFLALQEVTCSRAEQLWGAAPTQDEVTLACAAV